MIDDATLAAWERFLREPVPLGARDIQEANLIEIADRAIAEIRRLREVERAVWSQGLEADGQTMATLTLENQRFKASLAAHQAVVRELAKVLHPFTFPTEFEGSFIVMGRDVNRARQILTHPLVQRALGEKA